MKRRKAPERRPVLVVDRIEVSRDTMFWQSDQEGFAPSDAEQEPIFLRLTTHPHETATVRNGEQTYLLMTADPERLNRFTNLLTKIEPARFINEPMTFINDKEK